MKPLIVVVTILGAAATPFVAIAAPCNTDIKDQRSTVDPSPKPKTAPDARPASPGTTGAMDLAGSGSFTAEKSTTSADKGC